MPPAPSVLTLPWGASWKGEPVNLLSGCGLSSDASQIWGLIFLVYKMRGTRCLPSILFLKKKSLERWCGSAKATTNSSTTDGAAEARKVVHTQSWRLAGRALGVRPEAAVLSLGMPPAPLPPGARCPVRAVLPVSSPPLGLRHQSCGVRTHPSDPTSPLYRPVSRPEVRG